MGKITRILAVNIVDKFSLLLTLQRVLAAWLEIFN